MFKEGTLVSTSRGVIPIEQFGFARKENEASDCKPNVLLKTYEGEWNRCVYQTYKKTSGIKLDLESGFSISCSPEQKILTPKGLKKVKKLKVGEEVCCYSDVYMDKQTYFTDTEKIGYIPMSGNDVYIPKKMTEDLAMVCGILVNPSTTIRLNDEDKLVVVCKDMIVNKIFLRYIRDLFQTKQKMVVQDDQYCRIFSPYIIDFLERLCGLNHKKQKIHQSLLQSNRSIQIAFLNSLTMSQEENITGSLNITYLYTIASHDVSDQIESMLYLYSYMPVVKMIKGKKTICVRKPLAEPFSDRLLDRKKRDSRQSITTVKEISKAKIGDYFGIICEKNDYAIKNLVFGV